MPVARQSSAAAEDLPETSSGAWQETHLSIGGPLAHSAIVACEYDIPSVMAAGPARRIRSGQVIAADGSQRTVETQD